MKEGIFFTFINLAKDDHLANSDHSQPAPSGIGGANLYATPAGSHSLLHPT